jgi:bifunctional non-homologous end joining protein LigD/DNA ligase-1
VLKDGKPDFLEIQRRSLTSNSFKIQLAAAKLPATFTAFDLLYYQDRTTIDLPLMERKELLAKIIIKENERLAISRFIEKEGVHFYQLAAQNELEGIVAKKKDSKYYLGKRTKEWIKIKTFYDDDFVVCGYIFKEKGVISIILGQYSTITGDFVYKGHVTLGLSSKNFQIIKAMPEINTPLFKSVPAGNEKAIWIEPRLVCTVKYMLKTATGYMRQAVFKGLRDDKKPEECTT